MSRLVCVGTVVLAFGLGWGGVWSQAKAATWAKDSARLKSVPPGSERDRVQALIEEGYVQTRAGKIGFMEAGAWSTAYDVAVEDDVLSPAEVQKLEAVAAPWFSTGPLQTPDRVAYLLEMAAEETQQVKRVARTAERETTQSKLAFEKWEMPEDLESNLTEVGVKVHECESDVYGGMRTTDCDGAFGTQWVEVRVEEYQDRGDAKDDDYGEAYFKVRRGSTVMWLVVSTQEDSKALADKLVEESKLGTLDVRAIKSVADAAGFRRSEASCETDKGKYSNSISCEWDTRGTSAEVDLDVEKGEDDGPIEPGVFDQYGWQITQGGADLTVRVRKRAQAKTLYDKMTE